MKWVDSPQGNSTDLATDDFEYENYRGNIKSQGKLLGWVWHPDESLSSFLAVVNELPTGEDGFTFSTLAEAKAWTVAAVAYYRITGELAPKDIHKQEGV